MSRPVTKCLDMLPWHRAWISTENAMEEHIRNHVLKRLRGRLEDRVEDPITLPIDDIVGRWKNRFSNV